jgi:hypothetical protein
MQAEALVPKRYSLDYAACLREKREGHSLAGVLSLALALAAGGWTLVLTVLPGARWRVDPLDVYVAVSLAGTTAGLVGLMQRRRRRLLALMALGVLTANAAVVAGMCIVFNVD